MGSASVPALGWLLLLAATIAFTPCRCWKASSLGAGQHTPLSNYEGSPSSSSSLNGGWAHRLRLDANYDVYWTAGETDVTFEVQVRTAGYVIFGMSPSGLFQDADLVVGWVQNGRPRFQVTLPH